MEKIYKLNLLGRKFEIPENILSQIPYFSNYLSSNKNLAEYIFVYRSPMIFEHVLAYIIDKLYPYPSNYYRELDFYGIKYGALKELDLNDKVVLLEKKIDIINNINSNIFCYCAMNKFKCKIAKCLEDAHAGEAFCHSHTSKYKNICTHQENKLKCKKPSANKYCDSHVTQSKYCNLKNCAYYKMANNNNFCFKHTITSI